MNLLNLKSSLNSLQGKWWSVEGESSSFSSAQINQKNNNKKHVKRTVYMVTASKNDQQATKEMCRAFSYSGHETH
ncbi:hypothetical protein BpHYR1_023515 [Brachionus plicatilis]|uniref:Uncharacterized protein n=1 Tax=Brachionus plicatilis TaxID=10195 RepID=A0A3M7PYT6_BRAPC|nr:hypothetical protein BpHYR1_023515 [Brachionus plicatilis]